MIRIFLCDDVPELRALLRLAFADDADIEVVGEAGDAASGIERVAALRPDAILLDLSMPGMDGLEAIPRLAQVSPDTGIIVFSGFAAERMRRSVLNLGADRYLEKGEPLDTVRATVREVVAERRGESSGGGRGLKLTPLQLTEALRCWWRGIARRPTLSSGFGLAPA
jgi:DNA-binding NarL/FixJ family response regulator